MTLLGRLKMLKIFIHLLINPDRTDLIFQAINLLANAPDQSRVHEMEQRLLERPEFKQLFEEKYLPPMPSLAMLATCKPGTFGNAVYNHMTKNGLNFDLWPVHDSTRPIRYMTNRAYQDHDLWHALLGYGIEVPDELALQGFNAAQFQSPIAIMLISGGLLKMLTKDPAKATETFRRVNEGFTLGKKARFLLGMRLQDYFTTPLDEVRSICGLTSS